MKFMLPIMSLALAATPLAAEELVVREDRLFVPVEIAGEDALALLDSGAEVTIVDRDFAERIGLREGEVVDAHGTGAASVRAELVENVAIRTLGREIHAPVVAVIDLGDVGARLVRGPLPVVLGREVFDAGRLAIDFRQGRIEWVDDEASLTGTRLDLVAANGIETIPVRFGEVPAQADFDLGNGSGLLVSQAFADRLGFPPVGIEPGGGIGGAKGRAVVFVPALTIAGKTFRNVRAHVDTGLQVDANIGVAQLRAFRLVTDFPGRSVWFEPQND